SEINYLNIRKKKGAPMKCEQLKQKIEQFPIETRKILTNEECQHLAECGSCSEFYASDKFLSELVVKLKNARPDLKNPTELTEAILLGIDIKNKTQLFPSIYFQRILAAASVCLLMVFGLEHYQVFTKLNRLENEMQLIGMTSQNVNSNLDGSLEGILMLKLKQQNNLNEKSINNFKLSQYPTKEFIAALKHIKSSKISAKVLSQALSTNFSKYETKTLIEIMNSIDTEHSKSNN
ncbi:MAG: hypothetical protein Q8T08_03350, partial [Ignavibacteria bacterium]|nr:hypothetical protein [Ignavibacteria bacterium]